MGRHSSYTDEKADEICARLSVGETLRSICRDDHMPNWSTVYDWMNAMPEFHQRITHARELGFDAIAEECFQIADEPPPADDNGRTDSGHVAWQKNRIWTRTQLLAKWAPKRYGDRIELAGDKSAPLTVVVKRMTEGDETK